MTTTQNLSLPPEESWLPGRLLGPVVLYDSDVLHVVFADGDVYPVGILMHLTARFHDVRTLRAQREVGRQVSAFHHAPADHDGPHLRYRRRDAQGQGQAAQRDDTGLEDAFPWAHRGGRGIWRLGFWIACDVTGAAPLEYVLDWPAQAVHSAFGFTQEQIDEARRAARQLWPAYADGQDHGTYPAII
ncbi:MAG TPA: hypothetical protein VLM11_16200 [Streptosporangiaceae bacterium]|nr:hypothetical protein [Streptosporangiaceae bacterium]